MKAMVLEKPGEPLKYLDVEAAEPREGEISIDVAACGVCRTDLHVVDGDLANPKLPIIPGHEIVGTVRAIGGGVSF